MKRGFARIALHSIIADLVFRRQTCQRIALGQTYVTIATETGLSPALMHRVAVIGSGTLDILPHNGAVVTLLAGCGATHRQSYFDIVMVGIVGAVLALVAVT